MSDADIVSIFFFIYMYWSSYY